MNRIVLILALLAIIVVSGCAGSDNPSAPGETAQTAATAQSSGVSSGISSEASGGDESLPRPALASSELVVGSERFVFGLVDPETGQPISDVPEVTIQFFKVHDDGTATKVGDAAPIFRNENLPAGVYVVRTTFDQPGKWGALMLIKRQGKEPYQVKANFEVMADSSVPMIGEAAPRSLNETAKNAKVEDICSAVPQDSMHGMAIAEAVTSGKPTVILVAAPGFCPSFTCGPDLQLVQTLKSKYGDKANFVHIEAPNTIQNHTHEGPIDPNHRQEEGHRGVAKPQVKTAEEWGLKSEPWLFLVDEEGKIANRFEGGLTIDEVEPELLKVIQ